MIHTHTQMHLFALPASSLFLGGWSVEGGLAELRGGGYAASRGQRAYAKRKQMGD